MLFIHFMFQDQNGQKVLDHKKLRGKVEIKMEIELYTDYWFLYPDYCL